MTVCIAAICYWPKDNKNGWAIITASDRMVTRRGKSEYEPQQWKIGEISKTVAILSAGDYTVRSEARSKTAREVADNPIEDVGEIAELYGSFVRTFCHREAAQTYLSPVGLDSDSLLNGKDGQSALHLAGQMQSHALEAEAIIAGCDKHGAHIYHVDGRGFVTCHDDVGWLAIGTGADHAESQIMALGYAAGWSYAQTALMLYSAKKRAEVAPGVGPATDMLFLHPDGTEPLLARNFAKIATIHAKWVRQENQRLTKGVREFADFMKEAEHADQAAKAATSSSDQT